MRRALLISLLSHGVVAVGAGSWLLGAGQPAARNAAFAPRWLVLDSRGGREGGDQRGFSSGEYRPKKKVRAERGVSGGGGRSGESSKVGGTVDGAQEGGPESDKALAGSGASELELAAGTSPEYPSLSRRLGEEGEVTLEVSVAAPGGEVKAVRLLRSSGHQRLDQAAQRYLREAPYRLPPAPHAGTYTRVFALRYSLSAAEPGLAAASPERR